MGKESDVLDDGSVMADMMPPKMKVKDNNIVMTQKEELKRPQSAQGPIEYVEQLPQPPVPVQALTPHQMLSTLVTQGADPAVLEKFMDLADRWEANEAKKAYVRDMAKFKRETIPILKNKQVGYKNKDGSLTGYKHATLDHILEVVVPVLSKHGFSHAWAYDQEAGFLTVACRITHKQGHAETTALRGPDDKSGGKNAIQAIGSSSSYLERYTFLAITGLAAKDQDDDGRASEPADTKLLSEDQQNTIESMLSDNGLDPKKFLKYIKQESFKTIPVSSFNYCVQEIKATLKKRSTLKTGATK